MYYIICPMNMEPYMTFLFQRLTPARYQHSLGVMQVMEALAPLYGLDPDSAPLAGLAHDAAKELPLEQMLAIAQEIRTPLDHPSDREPLFLHGPCSAYVARFEMGIEDPLVLEAIARHTYLGDGRPRSTAFCWCLRLADMLEPGRDWHVLRQRVQPLVFDRRLGEAAHEMMEWLLPFLVEHGIPTHPAQYELQRKLTLLFAGKTTPIPDDQIPV